MRPCVQYQSDFCLCCLWSSSAWLYSWRTCRLCFCDYERQHCTSFNTHLLSQPSENPWFYNGTVPARPQMCSWEVCLHSNAASASVCFFQIAASSASRLSASDAAPHAELPEKVAKVVSHLLVLIQKHAVHCVSIWSEHTIRSKSRWFLRSSAWLHQV